MKIKKIFLVIMLSLISLSGFLAGQWVKKMNIGGVARHRATGISIGQKGYIGLGHVNGTGVNFAYSDWWEYDPATNAWTQKADYLLGQGYGASGFSIGNKGYVGSGVYSGVSWCEYSPVTNQWSLITTPPATGTELTAFVVNQKGYLVEGSNIYEYNPASNLWTTKASAPVSFNLWSTSFSVENSGFVFSGSNFYEYKPSVDQWIVRAPFPGQTRGGTTAFALLNKGYIISGYGNGWLSNVNRETWRFDSGANSWELAEEFPGSARRFHVGFSISERGYLGTGTNGTNFKDFWLYDPLLMELEEFDNEIIVRTFPNPATTYFSVLVKGNESLLFSGNNEFALYDNTGKLIKQLAVVSSTFNIDVSDLPNGIYIYHLKVDSQPNKIGKILVVK